MAEFNYFRLMGRIRREAKCWNEDTCKYRGMIFHILFEEIEAQQEEKFLQRIDSPLIFVKPKT